MISESNETIHHRICPFCEACCGLEITVAAGCVKRIRGHAADVFSHGYLCPKGVALKDLHEDPDRLRKPLIKRDGRFEEATWDEAFAEIERRLPPIIAKHGVDSVALTLEIPSSTNSRCCFTLRAWAARWDRRMFFPHRRWTRCPNIFPAA